MGCHIGRNGVPHLGRNGVPYWADGVPHWAEWVPARAAPPSSPCSLRHAASPAGCAAPRSDSPWPPTAPAARPT
eukprot:7187097-Prymnesium_polylepis.1